MRQKGIAIALVMLVTALLMACAPPTTPVAPTVPQSVTAVPQATAPVSTKPAWEEKWDKLVTAAQKEGTLVVASSIGPLPSRALAADFKNRYGISPEIVQGRGAELIERIFTERRAGLYTVDLWLGGGSTPIIARSAGILAPLEPMFMLPELTDPELIKKTWWQGKLLWVDPEHFIFPHAAYTSGQYIINTNMIKSGELKGWKALLDPKWKEKIVINDPTTPGSGLTWFAALVHNIMGLDYMRELVKQKPIVIRDQRLQVDWVAKGKYPIVVSAKEDVVYEFIRAGAPLEMILPEEGMYIVAGSGNLTLIKNAPHPNAAKLFVNYLLTKEAQTIFSREGGTESARVDVPVDHLEPIRRRQPGMNYFNTNELEFRLKMDDHYMGLAKEVFGPIMK